MTPFASLPPSPWIVRFSALISPASQVLDLACGAGRHSRWLARNGQRVTAVDRDLEGLSGLAEVPGVVTVAADLEGAPWPLSGRHFDAIVVTNYLHRPLLPTLAASLAPGGILLYETFMVGNEQLGKPARPEFLLQAGELLEFCRQEGLGVVAYEAGLVADPYPAVVQRLCARRDGAGSFSRLP